MKKIKLQLGIIVSFLMLLSIQNACTKKDGILKYDGSKNIDLINVEKKFFENTSNLNPILLRVIDKMKSTSNGNDLLKNLIKNDGYAVWDKCKIIIKSQNLNSKDQNGSSDTTVVIPLVVTGVKAVNSFLQAEINDSIALSLYRINEYKNLPLRINNNNVSEAEKHVTKFMVLDKDVFNMTMFEVIDRRLFNNTNADTSKISTYINLTSSINTGGRAFSHVCITISTTNYHCTNSGECLETGVCDACSLCQNTVDRLECFDTDGGGGIGVVTGGSVGSGWCGTCGSEGPNGGGGSGSGIPPINGMTLEDAQDNIAGQLNALMPAGSSFTFNQNLNPDSSLSYFNTHGQNNAVSNFLNYVQTFRQITKDSSSNLVDDYKKSAEGTFYLNPLRTCNIKVKIQLTRPPIPLSLWTGSQASSKFSGFIFSMSWEQDANPDINTYSDYIEVKVSGNLNYNVFLQGVGIIYSSPYSFKILIGRVSGEIYSQTFI